MKNGTDAQDIQTELQMAFELRQAILNAVDRGESYGTYMHALEHLHSKEVVPIKHAIFLEMSWRSIYHSGIYLKVPKKRDMR